MKKILALLLTIVFVSVCFTACGSSGKTLAEVKEAGVITMATSPDFPPFESLSADGKVEGIDMSGITVTVEDPDNNTARVEVNPETGEVILTFAE